MRSTWNVLFLAGMASHLGTARTARAEEPSFHFAEPADPAHVTWDGKAQVGLNVTSGNAFGISLSASAALSRKAGDDRVGAEVSGSFARTRVEVAADTNGTPGIGPGEVRDIVQTTTAAWSGKLRYDRFLGAHHSVYATASAAADETSGKRFIGGLQIGYSRVLHRSASQSFTVEAGYDLAHQAYVAVSEAVTVQSARLFAAYEWTPSPGATLSLGTELLTNVAPENTPTGHVSPLEDNRLTGRTELSLKVNEHGRLAIRLRARYDSHPAPKPPPPGAAWEAGYIPLADRLDTQTELLFVYQFL